MRNKLSIGLVLLASMCSKVLSSDIDVPILWPSGAILSSKTSCAMFEATLPHVVSAITSQPHKISRAPEAIKTWTLHNVYGSQSPTGNSCFAIAPNVLVSGLTNFAIRDKEIFPSLERTGEIIRHLARGNVSTQSLKTIFRLTDVIADPPPPVGLAFSICVRVPTHTGNEIYGVVPTLARYTLAFNIFIPGNNTLVMENQVYVSGLATIDNSVFDTNFRSKAPEPIDK